MGGNLFNILGLLNTGVKMNNEIIIIRALWGNNPRTLKEIFPFPIFKKEIVYVWGRENHDFLKERGFTTVLMGDDFSSPKYSTIHTQYYHKLEAIQKANNDYTEFIFLDWDCYLLRPLDNFFYQTLKEGNDTQVAIYAYNDAKYLGIPKLIMAQHKHLPKPTISEDLRIYMLEQEKQLRKYNWKQDNLLISPNFGFFYTRRPNIGNELMQIAQDNQIENCIEEHAMYLWANCSLDEFIKKYEPKILQGTSDEARTSLYAYDYENDPVIKINKYISSMVNKVIYLKHI
jgi:hypothetical protein